MENDRLHALTVRTADPLVHQERIFTIIRSLLDFVAGAIHDERVSSGPAITSIIVEAGERTVPARDN